MFSDNEGPLLEPLESFRKYEEKSERVFIAFKDTTRLWFSFLYLPQELLTSFSIYYKSTGFNVIVVWISRIAKILGMMIVICFILSIS